MKFKKIELKLKSSKLILLSLLKLLFLANASKVSISESLAEITLEHWFILILWFKAFILGLLFSVDNTLLNVLERKIVNVPTQQCNSNTSSFLSIFSKIQDRIFSHI